MGTTSIDGNALKKMLIAGSNALNRRRNEIDAMNVFPVPDGDTGINMSMTVLSAAREAAKLNTPNIYDVAKAASGGALRGARGNSGVILSQLFRGFAKGLEGVDVATPHNLSIATRRAMEMAYKAVMKPKEGTILTIAKALCDQAAISAGKAENIESFMTQCLSHANYILDRTPEMLPVLMQAGVVDAGGKGLLVVLEGALQAIDKPIENLLEIGEESPSQEPITAVASAPGDIKFGYCTEFFILHKEANEDTENHLKRYLETMGDSIVVVVDDGIIKIHVHTNNPGLVLEKAIKLGSVSNIKIDNMRLQHSSTINFSTQSEEEKPHKEVGFAAVSSGAGFDELFTSLGIDVVIKGGQTMNPSTNDILNAIERINADKVYVFPNNKNIILAAEQAVHICEEKQVIVMPTKSIPQGLSCMIAYSDALSLDENTEAMREAMDNTHSGQVTVAVRDTTIDDIDIREGDYLYLHDNSIALTDSDLQQGTKKLIEKMAEDGAEVIAIYYGQETSSIQAQELADFVQEKYPDIEVEIFNGGQPIYFYIISAE